jgi:cobalt-zinc-cadmium efflux system protein
MSHQHAHSALPSGPSQKPYIIGIVLNTLFIIGELIFAHIAQSTALFADALHSMSDVASLLLAWAAVVVFGLKASQKRTYGWHNTTILASFVNAILLLIAVAIIWWEAGQRLIQGGAQTQGLIVMLVAGVGIIINFVAARLFAQSGQHQHDLNARGAYLHLMADAGVSFGVLVSGLLVYLTEWRWLDPLVSIVIGCVIVWTSWDVFAQSFNLIVNGVPDRIDAKAVQRYLNDNRAIERWHDLHIWGLSTTEAALTVHVVLAEGYDQNYILQQLMQVFKTQFDVQHVTIQIEMMPLDDHCNQI